MTRPAPDNTPVNTTCVWMPPPLEEPRPVGTNFQRREPRRLLALPRNVLSTMPIGTTVVAPEAKGGANKTWRVDELDRVESDHWRVMVAVA